jgi:hypothetical protein
VSEFARALGAEEEIQHRDKTWKKSAMTMEVIAEFETFLENQAFDVLERQRRRLPEAEYEKRWSALARDVAAGSYGFLSVTGMQVYENAMRDPANKPGIELLYLRLKYGNPGCPEITREFAKEYIEANFEKVLRSLAKEMAPDPNFQGPSEATGGDGSESKPSSPDSQENPSASPSEKSAN